MSDWLKAHPPTPDNRPILLFPLYAAKWLEEEVLGTVKTSTWQTYESTLKNQLIPYFRGSCIDAITPALVQEFLFSMEPESVKPNAKNGSEPKKRRGESEKDIM